MAERVGGAVYELDLDTGKFRSEALQAESEFQRLGDRIDEIGSRMSRAGRALTIGITAPLIAGGIAAVKWSSDLDTTLSRIVGLVGDNADQVREWRAELLALGPVVGKSPRELAEALYFVRSSGIDASKSLETVEASAKGAAAGLGDTAVVAQAVTSAINAYGPEALSAAQATSILIATVREGKAEADELAGSIGRVIPIAAQLGVSFDQVGAALAAMTLFGLDTEESATALRGVFATLLKPSAQAVDILKAAGLSAEGLRQELKEKGLLSVLTTLATVFAGNEEALAAVIPNIRALTGFLSLAGKNADQVEGIFASLAATTENDLNRAFEAAADTTAFKWRQAMIALQAQAIRFGDTLAPIIITKVIPTLDKMIDGLERVIDIFERLPAGVQTGIIGLVAFLAIIGPLLLVLGGMASGISALIALAPVLAAAITIATGPIGLLVIAIAAVSVALFLLVKHWDTVWPALKRAPAALIDWIQAHVADVLVFMFAGPLGVLIKNWDEIFNRMPRPVQRAMNLVAGFIEGMVNGAIVALNKLIDAINGIIDGINRVPNWIQGEDIEKIPHVGDVDFTNPLTRGGSSGVDARNEQRQDQLRQRQIIAEGVRAGLDTGGGGGGGGTGDGGASAPTRLELIFQAISDGIIDLSEAIALGLTDQEVVTLELAAAQGDLEAKAYRARIGLLTLARVFPGMSETAIRTAIALQAIDAHLKETGKTIEQFIRDTAATQLDSARSLASSILGAPTREQLELELRLAELRRQRIQIENTGADDDDPRLRRLDAEIDAVEGGLNLRRQELEILRIKTQLADQSIDTDRQLINAILFLTAVIGNLSGTVAEFDGQLSALNTGGLPHYDLGGYVKSTGPAVVHRGEYVLTAAEARQLMAARPPGPLFTGNWQINATDEREIRQAARRQIDEGLMRVRRRGSSGRAGSVFRG